MTWIIYLHLTTCHLYERTVRNSEYSTAYVCDAMSTICQPSRIFPETSGILAHFFKRSSFRGKKTWFQGGKTCESSKTFRIIGITFW